jgi:hypothetical protein
MDTSEFGEVTKQKIGYRLREILNGKKQRLRSADGPYWAYSFDEAKLGRIAKKYGCSLVLKFSTEPTCEHAVPTEPLNNLPENHQLPENTPILGNEKSENPMYTHEIVTPVENSRTEPILEDLASNVKELTKLTTDFGIEECVLCKTKRRAEWQITLQDGNWGLLCEPCGTKLNVRLNHHD